MALFGVINLNKPLHCTSHDVVAVVRRCLGLKKVGHAGTLDPLASGVLPVCVGNATRLIEYLPSDKRYRATITFGSVTPTWDAEGELLYPQDASTLTLAKIEAILPAYVGEIEQTVPPHSAVHVNGKKLYERTRRGETVELPVRTTTIHSITLVDTQGLGTTSPTIIIDVHCASGTYIRSLAWAMGQQTGFGAYLSGLVRTAHGQFNLADAVDLETFKEHPDPSSLLISPEPYLPMTTLWLTEPQRTKVEQGQKLVGEDFDTLSQPLAHPIKKGEAYLLKSEQTLVGVGLGETGPRLKPIKILSHA